jgi:hypothetical protein
MKWITDTPNIPDDFKTITLRWPARHGIPCIAGKWKRLPDGRIEATYTRQELELIYSLGLFELNASKAMSQVVTPIP